MASKELKAGNKVKRKNAEGCTGIVKAIREEVSSSAKDTSEKSPVVTVEWDNGTTSVFAPDSLEIIAERA